MLYSEDKFFTELLNETIPEMQKAKELWQSGEHTAAEACFADYVRDTLRDDLQQTKERVEAGTLSPAPIIAEADRIVDGWVSACGFPWHFEDGKIDWNSNKTYNNYCEWTWQLSRHPEFVTLGRAYRITGDEKYPRRFEEMLLSWIEQAPCPENANPYSTLTWRTIEAGIRLDTWTNAIHMMIRSPSLSDHAVTLFFLSVCEHGYRLRYFNTGYNWLIIEMSGLFRVGVFFPFLKEGRALTEYAFSRLEEQLGVQVYPDGFQYELTTGYHGGIIHDYVGVIDVARKYSDIRIPESMLATLRSMYHLFVKLVEPDGARPNLNDGSDAPIRGEMQSALRLFSDDEIFRYFATDGREGRTPDYLSIALPYSGMAVFRTGWGKEAIWALFESAPFGKAHQHEDKLHFDLFAYGKRLLRDSGQYEYDTSDMRKYILSTKAHNTALVDGKDQNRRARYRWNEGDIAKKADLSWNFGDDVEVAEGRYTEGYGADFVDVTHRRKVIFFKKGIEGTKPFFVLVDTFSPQDGKEHLYEVNFQLDKEPIELVGKHVRVRHADGVFLSLISDAYPTVAIAQKYPRFIGWRKIRDTKVAHEHTPAPEVLFTGYGGEKTIVTVVYPTDEATTPIASVTSDKDGFTLFMVDNSKHFFAFSDEKFQTQNENP